MTTHCQFFCPDASMFCPQQVFLFAIYFDDIPTTQSLSPRSFIVLYADDILLIAPSINELQRLFRNCGKELEWLDAY